MQQKILDNEHQRLFPKKVILYYMSLVNVELSKFPFSLPILPFEDTAIEPILSKESFDFHHKKHHNAYVVKLNELVEKDSSYQNLILKEIIVKSEKEANAPIFNNAAQVWNHAFLWHSIKKNGGIKNISANAKEIILKSFASIEDFQAKLIDAGITQFGSGWAWVVLNKSTQKLEIIKTSNAQTPLTNENLKPLITVDVWEHAYYIDYRNRRPDFLKIFVEELINWDFFEKNIK